MINNAKLSGLFFYVHTNIEQDFQIGLSISLKSVLAVSYFLTTP